MCFRFQNEKEDLIFLNPLLLEVKEFYSNEYKIGRYAIGLINNRAGTKLSKDEVVSIALHIVNAE